MIKSQTYLRVNRAFVPLETFEGAVADSSYIEGAIELSVDGKAILTRNEYDLVDQLWAYIVDGACDVARNTNFLTGFPDQPLDMLFNVDQEADSVTIELHVPGGRSVTLPRREFLAGIAREAKPVFVKLLQLVPENCADYEHVLRQIETLNVSIK